MAIHFGNDNIKDIYVGSDKIKEVYYGSEKVWGEIESLQDGYWVHKDTGVKTYFGLEDSSIEDGIMGYPSWMPNCSEVKLPSGVTGFKTYNWVIEEWDNYEATYIGFVHSEETYIAGNEVLIGVDLSNTSISSISQECFYGCSALTSITLPESVSSLETYCFAWCTSLTSITLPDSVTSLGDSCFSGCASLLSITLPESVTSLGNGCFNSCSSLASINIPVGVTSLGSNCFYGCTSLTSITLPEGVTSLEYNCFYECTSLTSVTLPEGITSIDQDCFYGCTSLTSVTLPEGVTSIGFACFYNCISLTLATVLPATPPTLGTNAFGYVHSSFNIKVRSPYVTAYKTATNWAAYAAIISAI